MALAPQGARDVFSPDTDIVFRRTIVSDDFEPELEEVRVRGYSNDFGGQGVFGPTVKATTSTEKENGRFFLHIDFRIDPESHFLGSDAAIEYTVTDGNLTRTFEFFHQNGVWDASESGDQVVRLSSELDRQVLNDGDDVDLITDWSDNSEWCVVDGDVTYISTSSSLTKHSDETIPYYYVGDGSAIARGPTNLFDNREFSAFFVVQFDADSTDDFDVLRLNQGDSEFAAIVNDRGDVRLESEFADGSLYVSNTYAGTVLAAEIHVSSERAQGTVNREIDREATNPTGSSTEGTSFIELNPNEEQIDLKLFELLAYDEDVSSGFTRAPDRIAKQFSYLYNIDMTCDTRKETVKGVGSPDIANHLFFEDDKDMYGFYTIGGSSLKLFDERSLEREFSTTREITALATDTQNFVYIGEKDSNRIRKLTKKLDEIWEVMPQNGPITGVDVDLRGFVYASSEDSSVVKLNPEGGLEWKFDEHEEPVNDVAVDSSQNVYTAANWRTPDQNTVRKVNSEGETVWESDAHLDDVTVIEVDKEGLTVSGSVNSEVRLIDKSGNVAWCYTASNVGESSDLGRRPNPPFHRDEDDPLPEDGEIQGDIVSRQLPGGVTVETLDEEDSAATVNEVVLGSFEDDTPNPSGIFVDVIEEGEGKMEVGGIMDLAVTSDFVYIVTEETIDKVDKVTGDLVWREEFRPDAQPTGKQDSPFQGDERKTPSGVTIAPNRRIYVGFEDGSVSRIDDEDGNIIWTEEDVHVKVAGIQAQPGSFEPHWR